MTLIEKIEALKYPEVHPGDYGAANIQSQNCAIDRCLEVIRQHEQTEPWVDNIDKDIFDKIFGNLGKRTQEEAATYIGLYLREQKREECRHIFANPSRLTGQGRCVYCDKQENTHE